MPGNVYKWTQSKNSDEENKNSAPTLQDDYALLHTL